MSSLNLWFTLILCFPLLQWCYAHSTPHASQKKKSAVQGRLSTANSTYDPYFYLPEDIPLCDLTRYEIMDVVGNGSDGEVGKMMEKETKNVFALKFSHSYPEKLSNLRKEIHILTKLKGLGITGDIHCVDKDMAYFMMDFLEGQLLGDYIQLPSINQKKDFLLLTRKMAEQLARLHEQDLVHLDPHPWNWIFNPSTEELYLVDLGRGYDLKITDSNDICVSKEYDVYLTGAVWKGMYYTILMDKMYREVLESLSDYGNRFLLLPKHYQETIQKMLNECPRDRPTFSQIMTALSI